MILKRPRGMDVVRYWLELVDGKMDAWWESDVLIHSKETDQTVWHIYITPSTVNKILCQSGSITCTHVHVQIGIFLIFKNKIW